MAKFTGKTVKFVEGTASKLQVPEGAQDVQLFDSVLRGFGMRRFAPSKQFPKGKCSYFCKFTVKGQQGQQRRVTLGEVIDGNLKAMRQQASEIMAKRNQKPNRPILPLPSNIPRRHAPDICRRQPCGKTSEARTVGGIWCLEEIGA